MTNKEHLVEQHVRESESRLRHLDELLAKAQGPVGDSADRELEETLGRLRAERDRMASHLQTLRFYSVRDWRSEEIEMAGPMAVWDALAQGVEELVERLERPAR